MVPHHWKRAPADNQSSDPNADLRKDRPANTVVGAIRGLMTTAAASRDDVIGGLVAARGANNVYGVYTNEGLIDPATQVGGLTSAITAPFLLRASFDATLVGAVTNIPHLNVDGFDCGPILRRDGSALADGDLVKGVPVLLQGDMAAPTDTKVTRVRVFEPTLGELAKIRTVGQRGSVTLPGGLIFQWDSVVAGTDVGGNALIPFSMQFPTGCFIVAPTNGDGSTVPQAVVSIYAGAQSASFVVHVADGLGNPIVNTLVRVNYIAIGN